MSDAPETIRAVVIRGRVQRVGFRNWVEYTARRHRLAGWVRNRRDGAVEALFAGSKADVDAMVAACGRGPPSAHVETVEPRDAAADELALRQASETFSVLPTV